jgi:prevent-host-death family protein
MTDTYSIYEAKARLSALVRQVRAGRHITITVHGHPVAELRPVAPESGGLVERLDRLAERGVLVRPAEGGPRAFAPIARRPGALKRFLDERD